jgi:hypothetical protein
MKARQVTNKRTTLSKLVKKESCPPFIILCIFAHFSNPQIIPKSDPKDVPHAAALLVMDLGPVD